MQDTDGNTSDFGACFERYCPRSDTERLIVALRDAHPEAEVSTFVVRPEPVPVVQVAVPAPVMVDIEAQVIPASPMQQIIKDVAAETGVSRDDLLGKSRLRTVVRARWIAMHRMRELGYSYPAIGRRLGKDHTTVLSGVRKYKWQLRQQETV